MKNKRAEDKNNWKAEWIKGGGDELVHSLATEEEDNSHTMERNKNKVNLQRRKHRADTGKSRRDISDGHA